MIRPIALSLTALAAAALAAAEPTTATVDSASITTDTPSATMATASATTGTTSAAPETTAVGAPINLSNRWRQNLDNFGAFSEDFLSKTHSPEVQSDELKRAEARRHYFMATYYLENDQPAHALGEFRAALEDAPDNTNIKLGIAEANLRSKNFDGAREIIDQILEIEPANVKALEEKARMLMGRSEETSGDQRRKYLDESIAAYNAGLEVEPKNLELLRGVATAYFSTQDIPNIIRTYERIVDVNPRDTHALLVLGNVYLRTQRPKEALPYFQRVTEMRRGFIQGYIYLAQTQFELNRVNEALRTFKDAILIEPRNGELLRRFDLVLQDLAKRKNGTPVIRQYERFAREYPLAMEINRLYAEKLIEADDFPAAIAQYQKVLKLDPENIETLTALGRLQLQRGNFDEAIKHFSRAVEIDPEKLEIYDEIAVSLIGQKNRPKAIELYEKAIANNPKAQRLYISLAVVYQQDGKTSDAITTLEQGIQAVGPQAEFLALIGQNYDAAGEPAKAADAYGKAYALAPTNTALFTKLMTTLLRRGDDAALKSLLTVAEESFQDRKDEFMSLVGDIYYTEGHSPEAITYYEKALQVAAKKAPTIARLVQVYNVRGEYDKSLELLRTASIRPSADDDLVRLKIDTLLGKKDFDAAASLARDVVAASPENMDAYRILVDVLNKAGRGAEALEAVAKAEQKFGAEEDVESLRGITLYQQKKYAEAEKVFRDLARTSSRGKDLHYYFLGSVYLDQKRYEAAETAFRRAIEANPNNDSALNALGYMLANNGVKLDEAEELIARALALNPAAGHILDSMGWVLFKKGKFDEALEYVEKAHRIMGDDAEILDHLGDIYAAKGDTPKALEYWRKSLAVDDTREDVRAKIAKQER